MSTFVSVGNATQPFDRLLEAVSASLAELPQPVFVQHGAGADIFEGLCARAPFVTMDEFALRVAQADLLIVHAGAGSIIHAVRAGKVPVVMPRRQRFGEHVDDHQVEFAHELATSGKIVVCDEAGSLPAAAREALRRQRAGAEPHTQSRMLRLVRDALLPS